MGCNCHSTVQRLATGAVGLAKAATGLGYVNSATLIQRRKICGACPNNRGGFCADCGCLILAKTTQANQTCRFWENSQQTETPEPQTKK